MTKLPISAVRQRSTFRRETDGTRPSSGNNASARNGSNARPQRTITPTAQIDGISDVTAHVMVAEIGVDMTRFPSSGHLVSWAGLCPRNDESAGKRRSTRVRKSGTWLKTALVTAAWAAIRVKKSYLHAQFLRLKAAAAPRKPSSPWLPPCSPPPTSCCVTESSTKASERITSITATRLKPFVASSGV